MKCEMPKCREVAGLIYLKKEICWKCYEKICRAQAKAWEEQNDRKISSETINREQDNNQ